MDNASNNNTLARALRKSIYNTRPLIILIFILIYIIVLFECYNVKQDSKHYRVRCQGYILNLLVYSFLFITNKENLKDDSLSTPEISQQLKLIDETSTSWKVLVYYCREQEGNPRCRRCNRCCTRKELLTARYLTASVNWSVTWFGKTCYTLRVPYL